MALVTCPECEARVSDQAAACPKCGFPMDVQTCPECGQQIPGPAVRCPACGHPTSAGAAAVPSQEQVQTGPQVTGGDHTLAAAPAPTERGPGPLGWYFRVWQRFGEMRGRSPREEYWWFVLFNLAAWTALATVDGVLELYSVNIGLPVIGYRSGPYALLALIPTLFTAWNALATVVGVIGLSSASFVGVPVGVGYSSGLYALAALIPSISIGVRRMHDTGRSGWLLLILLVPVVGWIIFVILAAQHSERGPNRFGPSPMHSAAVTTPEPAVAGQ